MIVVVHACGPNYLESIDRRTVALRLALSKNVRAYFNNKKQKRAGRVTQVVEHLSLGSTKP
jgi:hypothetical protein